ncbi:MAG: tetratricopeptide repeat protein, partial [Ferruginibacter sp.]
RGMAYLGKNDIPKATIELSLLKEISMDTTLKQLTIWGINSTYDIVQIAVNVLSAEIYQKQQQFDKSIVYFNQAIALEDNLNYDEPPDWFFSVRHQLGTVLLKANKYKEAEKVYLEDLLKYKENGWSLTGLYEAVQKQGRSEDAENIKKRFVNAWRYADTKILSSSIL